MPESFERWGKRWAELHPAWEIRLWHEGNLPHLDNGELFDAAAEYVHEPRVGQFRSDVARYEILRDHGGVYVDCDFEPRRSIDELLRLAEGGCFACWEEPGRWVGNSIIGAKPGHPFLAELVAGLRRSAGRAKNPTVPSVISGPIYLSRIYNRRRGRDVRVFPRTFFYPYGWDELDREAEEFPDAYAIHHWANKRRQAGEPIA